MGYLTSEQVANLGFASIGDNVLLSEKASYYNCKNIQLGNNVRVDDFCVISAGEGGIVIGNYIHLAVYCSMMGKGKITMEDFSGLSARVSVYSSSDDYSGCAMTNPTVPPQFTNVQHGDVNIGRHVIIGAGSVVLPGVNLEEGVAIGALSLVKKSCRSFGIYMGVPAKRISDRKNDLLEKEKELLASCRVKIAG